MKYQVLLTDEATKDFNALEKIERKKILKAFDIIENVDIAAVNTRPLFPTRITAYQSPMKNISGTIS